MKLSGHCIASAVVSTALYGLTGSGSLALAALGAGVLVDLDHLVDFWRDYPWNFKPGEFFRVCRTCGLKRSWLFLHSVELLVPLGIAAVLTHDPLLTGLSIGLGQHFVLDYLANPVRDKGYFFFYRLKNGFRSEEVFYWASPAPREAAQPAREGTCDGE